MAGLARDASRDTAQRLARRWDFMTAVQAVGQTWSDRPWLLQLGLDRLVTLALLQFLGAVEPIHH
jgi:hypothetical protein